MKIWHLTTLVMVLAVCVWLALTNPSTEAYLAFLEQELLLALDRSEQSQPNRERAMVRAIFRSHSHELVTSVVRPHTIRQNWGLFSRFTTDALDTHFVVLGIAGHFIPLEGVDEAILRFGRMAF